MKLKFRDATQQVFGRKRERERERERERFWTKKKKKRKDFGVKNVIVQFMGS